MIHPSNIYNRECSPIKTTRIVTEKELTKFKGSINKFINELSRQQNPKDKETIEKLLNNNLLLGKQLIENYTTKFEINN